MQVKELFAISASFGFFVRVAVFLYFELKGFPETRRKNEKFAAIFSFFVRNAVFLQLMTP